MPFQAGYDKPAAFQAVGSSSASLLAITGHSWSEMVDKLDLTSTGHQGVQALLAGILRGDGNVKANFDSSAAPWNATIPRIRAGTKGLCFFYVGLTLPWVVPCMVTKLNCRSAVEGKVEYDFDVSLDAIASLAMNVPYSVPA